MHKHIARHSGYTLVELIVVIAVLAILAAVAITGYTIVARDNRDSKRQADISAFAHTLETYYLNNGSYPIGCAMTGATCATVTASGSSNGDSNSFIAGGNTPINASASLATTKSILPGLTDNFRDPRSTASTPFLRNTGTENVYSYFYAGGLFNATTASKTYYVAFNGNAPLGCQIAITLAPNQASSYVAGYYDESDNKWHLRGGNHGVKFTTGGTAPDIACAANSKAGAMWAD